MKKIYLAGPISGLTYDDAQDWRNKFSAAIDYRIECFSPLRGKDYLTKQGKLEGSYDEFPLFTDQGITTRDRYDCMGADLVVFYMLGATERVSIGTMIELGWADAMRRPAILIMEKEGNVHDHSMVRQTTHFRVDNMNDAVRIAEIILLGKAKQPKFYDAEPMKLSDTENWSGLPK
jgi:nucleoside 2-deoxyribosyltransferase